MNKKLIEEMARDKYRRNEGDCVFEEDPCAKYLIADAKETLKVIRQNVHLVAEVCPDAGWKFGKCNKGKVWFIKDDKEYYMECNICKGHGVIAKQERMNSND